MSLPDLLREISGLSGQKIGQIIYNALSYHDLPENVDQYDRKFRERLLTVDDETFIKALQEWLELVKKVTEK